MSHELELLQPLLTRLHGHGRLRVWSVVVSIFGDLVQPRQQPLSVQELLCLTTAIGIEENALRTALSRLAKEGWLERHKRGRLAYYALSESGKQTFLEASKRIYHPAFTSASAAWYLATDNQTTGTADHSAAHSLNVGRHWQLINAEDLQQICRDDMLLFRAEAMQVPNWAFEQLVPVSVTTHYRQLLSDVTQITGNAQAITRLSPLCAIVLRALLIHAWRRLVLRHPLMPQALLPDDWPGLLCHQHICSLYPLLIERSETWWEQPTCSAGTTELMARFRPE